VLILDLLSGLNQYNATKERTRESISVATPPEVRGNKDFLDYKAMFVGKPIYLGKELVRKPLHRPLSAISKEYAP
jgi:hypothetical protein